MKKITDERVVAERRKIQSDAYGLMILGLLIAVLIQQFVFVAPVEQYAVELLFVVGAGVYNLIRTISSGMDIYGGKVMGWKAIIVRAIPAGILAMLLNSIITGLDDVPTIIISGAVFMAMFILVQLGIWLLNKRKQQKIDRKLDEDETQQ